MTSSSSMKKKMIKSSYYDLLEELIMYEILPRLPINSLIRFTLVCKKWHNLITLDPLFITNHSHHHNTTTNLSSSCSTFFCNKREIVFSSSGHNQYSQFRLPEPRFVSRFTLIMGSTNGLLYGFRYQCTEIFICNPITKHVVCIPSPPKHPNAIALACDPYNNPNFGFMIIAMGRPREDDPNCYQFEVYSSKTGEWRVSKNAAELRVPCCRHLRPFGSVFTGGRVYWSLVTHIAWFDVDEDVAGLVPCLHSEQPCFS